MAQKGHIILNPGKPGNSSSERRRPSRDSQVVGKVYMDQSTFPETHIFAPENGWLQKTIRLAFGVLGPVLREWIDRSFI